MRKPRVMKIENIRQTPTVGEGQLRSLGAGTIQACEATPKGGSFKEKGVSGHHLYLKDRQVWEREASPYHLPLTSQAGQ